MDKVLSRVSLVLVFIIIVSIGFFAEITLLNRQPEIVEATNGRLNLSDHHFEFDGPVRVSGTFRFIPNHIIYDDEYLVDYLDEAIPQSADSNWTYAFEENAGKGVGTYIVTIDLPKPHPVLRVEIPRIATASKVWANGKEVWAAGRVSEDLAWVTPEEKIGRFMIDEGTGQVRLLIQVANPASNSGGLEGAVIIGTGDQIINRQVIRTVIEASFVATAFLIGFYHLFLYSVRTDEPAALVFGLFSISFGMGILFVGEGLIYHMFPMVKWRVSKWLELFLQSLSMLLIVRYYLYLNRSPKNKAYRNAYIVILMSTALWEIVALGTQFEQTAEILHVSVFVIISAHISYIVLKGVQEKQVGLDLSLLGVLSLIVFVGAELIWSQEAPNLAIGGFFFLFSQALTLGARYSYAFHLNFKLSNQLQKYSLELEHKNEQLSNSRDELADLNKGLDEEVSRRSAELKMLLDHGDQGFMSADRSGVVNSQYSQKCLDILGHVPAGNKLSTLLTTEQEDAAFLDDVLQRIFSESSESRREGYLSLMPKEVKFGEITAAVAYKWIDDIKPPLLMVILTDISEQLRLIEQIENEDRTQRMRISVLQDQVAFNEVSKEYIDFWAHEVPALLEMETPPFERIIRLKKRLHRFKGSFSMFSFEAVVVHIHEAESALGVIREWNREALAEWYMKYKDDLSHKARLSKLTEEQGILLGGQNGDRLSQEAFERVSTYLYNTFSKEVGDRFVNEIGHEETQSIRKLLHPYQEYCVRLADEQGKILHPLVLSGCEICVRVKYTSELFRDLVHLFRNMIAHGIEPPQLRAERGKPIAGTIMVEASSLGQRLLLRISDDGAGIDVRDIRRRLNERGELAENLSEVELLSKLFEEEISTADHASTVAGRGIGLSILHDTVTEMDGSIEIETNKGNGTTFIIQIPNAIEVLSE